MSLPQRTLEYTLTNEGGFTNNPNDSGGATNFGITIGDYSRWLGRPATISEVQNMTVTEAGGIYERYYWSPLGLGAVDLPGVATAIFDQSVLNGLGFLKTIQSLLGVESDGEMGPITVAAINAQNQADLIERIISERTLHYRAIVAANPKDAEFLAGWENRTQRLRTLEAWA